MMLENFEHTNDSSKALRELSIQNGSNPSSLQMSEMAVKVEDSTGIGGIGSTTYGAPDEPFDPAVEGRKKNGSYQLALPRSMFSSMILMPMVEPVSIPTPILIFIHGPQYLVYLLVICAQFTICFFLAGDALNNTNAEACKGANNSNSFLRFVCVATFCSFCFSDILESAGIWRWCGYLPRWNKEQEELVKKMKTGSLLFEKRTMIEKIGACPDQKVSVFKPKTGITSSFKNRIFYFVIMPKAFIAILLMFVGSGFIVRADGISDIVLKTVAVSFVLQVDDFAYRGFTTSSMKILFESIPPIGLFEKELVEDRSLDNWEIFGSIFMLFLLMFAVVVQFGCWCWI